MDQGRTCFTTVSGRLTKTTETAERKGEKRIWEEVKGPDEIKDDERADKGEVENLSRTGEKKKGLILLRRA